MGWARIPHHVRPLTSEARAKLTGARPKRSQFDSTWSQTLATLMDETRHLGAREFVLMLDVVESDIRLDGQIRANARPASEATAVAIESPSKGSLLFATDRFDRWQDNARAIALGIEALRKVERYGIVQSDEQYRGWQALPPGTPMPAAKMTVEQAIQLLTEAAGNCGTFDPLHDPDQIDVAFRMAARRNHPDVGGDADTFRQITEARDLLRREVGA